MARRGDDERGGRGRDRRGSGRAGGERGRATGERGHSGGDHGRATGERGRSGGERGRATGERGHFGSERGRATGERGRSATRSRSAGERRGPPSRMRPLPPKRPVPQVHKREFPEVVLAPPAPVRPGEQLYTTRPGAERDLLEEIFYSDPRVEPRHAGPSLVATRSRPMDKHHRAVELAFARQGFPVGAVLRDAGADALANEVRAALARAGAPQPWAFDVWVPDADATNPLAQRAAELQAAATERLRGDASWGAQLKDDARAAFGENGLYAQACLVDDHTIVVGASPAREAPSLAPGGRLRVHVPKEAPSRAAMKLVEALTWLDRGPEPGDLCVDLGAAPGGWTWVLLERRARVLAVDPGELAPSVRGKKGLVHLRADAFRIEPEEPMDWLFCDMAFRPLEVAGLLAKWARNKWARLLVANIKLPMTKKAQMLFRVRDILTDGGWSSLRVRQLYHDRDEVTFAAVRLT